MLYLHIFGGTMQTEKAVAYTCALYLSTAQSYFYYQVDKQKKKVMANKFDTAVHEASEHHTSKSIQTMWQYPLEINRFQTIQSVHTANKVKWCIGFIELCFLSIVVQYSSQLCAQNFF